MTIGEKIRKVRQLYGYTQSQLAFISSLPLATIKQYESNRRTPKAKQLNQLSDALGVSIEYLTNHNIDSYNDIKHVLLELEETFGLNVTKTEDSYVLKFNNMELTNFLKQWYDAKNASNKSTQTLKEYELWKVTYPEELIKEIKQRLRSYRDKDQSNNL